MKLMLIVVWLALIGGGAEAQESEGMVAPSQPWTITNVECVTGCDYLLTQSTWATSQRSTHAKTGDAELDRAMAICDAHPNLQRAGPPYRPDDARWAPSFTKSCEVTVDEWGRKDLEQSTKSEADDRAWLDGFVGRLGR